MRIANPSATAWQLTLPIERTLPVSINELSNRINRIDDANLTFNLNYTTDYRANFRLSKTVGYLFIIEMVGQLEEHGEALTYVEAQTRISLFTYAVILTLFALTLILLPSPLAGLFGLLGARMVLLLVVCAPDAYQEIAGTLG